MLWRMVSFAKGGDDMAAAALRFRDRWITLTNVVPRMRARPLGISIALAAAVCILLAGSSAGNGLGRVPYRAGAPSASKQCEHVMNEQNILAHRMLSSSGLGEPGVPVHNLDAGWNEGEDGYAVRC